MLVTASTVIQTAIDNRQLLQSKRATWDGTFFDDLKTHIETTAQTYLGVDSAKDLRQATAAITAIQKQALKNLQK